MSVLDPDLPVCADLLVRMYVYMCMSVINDIYSYSQLSKSSTQLVLQEGM